MHARTGMREKSSQSESQGIGGKNGKATPGWNEGYKGTPTLASRGNRRLIFMIARPIMEKRRRRRGDDGGIRTPVLPLDLTRSNDYGYRTV